MELRNCGFYPTLSIAPSSKSHFLSGRGGEKCRGEGLFCQLTLSLVTYVIGRNIPIYSTFFCFFSLTNQAHVVFLKVCESNLLLECTLRNTKYDYIMIIL